MLLNALLFSSTFPPMSKQRRRQIVFDIAYSLVWEAKRVWGEDDGHIKKAYVKAKLYIVLSTMPSMKQCIVTEECVEGVIEDAYAKMKEFLSAKEGK